MAYYIEGVDGFGSIKKIGLFKTYFFFIQHVHCLTLFYFLPLLCQKGAFFSSPFLGKFGFKFKLFTSPII